MSQFCWHLCRRFSVGIVQLSLPAFNELTDKKLFIDYGNVNFRLLQFGFVVFTGIIAGKVIPLFSFLFPAGKSTEGTFKKTNALLRPEKC